MTDLSYTEKCASILMNATLIDREQALRRYLVICEVQARCHIGESKSAAVCNSAARCGVHPRTVWGWLLRLQGVPHEPSVWARLLLGRPDRRKPHPEHHHLHRNCEIVKLEEAINVGS